MTILCNPGFDLIIFLNYLGLYSGVTLVSDFLFLKIFCQGFIIRILLASLNELKSVLSISSSILFLNNCVDLCIYKLLMEFTRDSILPWTSLGWEFLITNSILKGSYSHFSFFSYVNSGKLNSSTFLFHLSWQSVFTQMFIMFLYYPLNCYMKYDHIPSVNP